MRDASDIRFSVNGVEYGDIISATLTRGLEQVVDSVALEVSEKWMQPGQTRALPFRTHDPFEFIIDGKVVVTGYISALPRGYTGISAKRFTINGMSKAWLAVKGSYVGKVRRWSDAPLLRILTDIMGTFEIDVSAADGLADLDVPFEKFGASIGESAWSIAQRALRLRGLWARSMGDGSLRIEEAGTLGYSTPIIGRGVEGKRMNVLSASFDDPAADLHSVIYVVGQSARRLDWSGDQAAGTNASAKDESVTVPCPLVLVESGISKHKDLEDRAKWEVRTRAGRARQVTYTVQSAYWDGKLLEPNRMMNVDDPALDLSGEFLISSATTSFGSGTTTTLALVPPDAFLRKSPPPKRSKKPRRRDGKVVEW